MKTLATSSVRSGTLPKAKPSKNWLEDTCTINCQASSTVPAWNGTQLAGHPATPASLMPLYIVIRFRWRSILHRSASPGFMVQNGQARNRNSLLLIYYVCFAITAVNSFDIQKSTFFPSLISCFLGDCVLRQCCPPERGSRIDRSDRHA